MVDVAAWPVAGGLSPRTRGRRRRIRAAHRGGGSIPANAGETLRDWSAGSPGRVYPRERGGDPHDASSVFDEQGLSPRTRGRRCADRRSAMSGGSIPANAGETPAADSTSAARRVYPRERGGDNLVGPIGDIAQGLSPRTRGRRPQGEAAHGRLGSIPANAGETSPVGATASLSRVYPRERGGDSSAPATARRRGGLSPRTRGRPADAPHPGLPAGSIPANAGETAAADLVALAFRVYPRERGGDWFRYCRERSAQGLSPRTRGRPQDAAGRRQRRGSIPANAGETRGPPSARRTTRVYPRERGGDVGPAKPVVINWGLSPRTRGRPRGFFQASQ